MLSILIPIYNFDCRILVKHLLSQAIALEQPFEMICLDDHSIERFSKLNREMNSYSPFIQYEYLQKNIGRAKIRNVLAAKAQFPYLLFMDCDSAVRHDNYLKKYLANCRANTVICGGRNYAAIPPENAFRLHWEVGRKREQLSAQKRNRNPHHQFMTNNFLVPKKIFSQLQFDETVTQYGHEDTLFGLALNQLNINVLHIYNPLEHIDLENAPTFLKKTEQAIENLVELSRQGKAIDTKLLRTFHQLEQWKLLAVAHFFFRRFSTTIHRNLRSSSPSLRVFDLYKLGKIIEKM